ncbi:MAG TPA: CvpA family protein [Acidisphaera sp.]|nr:CvpA family protein [Acidisphaera sp.]
MTWVDLAVLAIVAISGLLAFVRGFVREVLGIAAWVGAVIAAVWAFPQAQPEVARYVTNPDLIMPVTYGVVFVAVLILLLMVSHWIGALVRRSVLGGMDRSLGLLFGLARGAALVVAAYIAFGLVQPVDKWPEPVLQARALPFTYEGASWVVARLPEQYRPRLYAPPAGREATEEALLHPTPLGRASDKPPQRP